MARIHADTRKDLYEWSLAMKSAPRHGCDVGEDAGRDHLKLCVTPHPYEEKLAIDNLLVVGPDVSARLAIDASAISDWLKSRGRVLALGLEDTELNSFLPFKITTNETEQIGLKRLALIHRLPAYRRPTFIIVPLG